MIKLVKIELQKILAYKTFWIFSILYSVFLLLLFTSFGGVKMNINAKNTAMGMIYNFPDLWHNLTYLAGWFNILLYMFVILLVTNEFMFKTLRQNIIDGLSKFEVIISKLIVIFLFSLASTLFLIIIAIITGFTLSEKTSADVIFEKTGFLLAFFVQSFGYMTFALFISIIFRRQGLAIIFFLIYAVIIENIIALKLPENISLYLPLETFNNLIKSPFTKIVGGFVPQFPETNFFIASLVYIILFSGASYLVLDKSDI